MIIKGKARSGPEVLGPYLKNAERNERVSVLEIKGTVSRDIVGALVEMDAYAAGTRCERTLYHAQISPEPPYRLTPDQITQAVDTLEKKLGFDGQARTVVMHEKDGREHFHVVWARTDLKQMRAISDSHNYRHHEEASRELERMFGHPRVQGAHAERDGVDRPDRTPSRAELRQEERTGIKGKDVKTDVTEAFRASDGAEAFKAALEDKGYILAKGDRRDFVVVDRAGGIHSLARRIDGMKAAELREFMAPISRDALPTTEQAREIADERERRQREVGDDTMLEQAYSRGDDYVNQTRAALNDHRKRQSALDDSPRPQRPSDDARIEEIRSGDDDRKRSERHAKEQTPERGRDEGRNSRSDNNEITDRMRRMLDSARDEERDPERDADLEPDRQREAPGGGRTRSR